MIFSDHHNIHDFSEWNILIAVAAASCAIIGFYIKLLQSKEDSGDRLYSKAMPQVNLKYLQKQKTIKKTIIFSGVFFVVILTAFTMYLGRGS